MCAEAEAGRITGAEAGALAAETAADEEITVEEEEIGVTGTEECSAAAR